MLYTILYFFSLTMFTYFGQLLTFATPNQVRYVQGRSPIHMHTPVGFLSPLKPGNHACSLFVTGHLHGAKGGALIVRCIPTHPHPPLQLLAQLLSGFINQLWSLFAGFMVPYPVRAGSGCCKGLFGACASCSSISRHSTAVQPDATGHALGLEVDEPHLANHLVSAKPMACRPAAQGAARLPAGHWQAACLARSLICKHLPPDPPVLQDPVRPGWLAAD